MADAELVQIAEAVATEIGAATFSMTPTVLRNYNPKYVPKDTSELQLTIAAGTIAVTTASRGQCQYEYTVDVGMHKKIEPDAEDATETDQVDALLYFQQEVADYFRLRRLTEYEDAIWSGTAVPVPFSRDAIEEERVFFSVITFTFKVIR